MHNDDKGRKKLHFRCLMWMGHIFASKKLCSFSILTGTVKDCEIEKAMKYAGSVWDRGKLGTTFKSTSVLLMANHKCSVNGQKIFSHLRSTSQWQAQHSWHHPLMPLIWSFLDVIGVKLIRTICRTVIPNPWYLDCRWPTRIWEVAHEFSGKNNLQSVAASCQASVPHRHQEGGEWTACSRNWSINCACGWSILHII